MPNYPKIIRLLESDELEQFAASVLERLSYEELTGYVPSEIERKGQSEEQLRQRVSDDLGIPDEETGMGSLEANVARKKQIDFLIEQEDYFAEVWEEENETGEAMHPDENDDAFFEHEDPDDE